jgi:hypothetical protein
MQVVRQLLLLWAVTASFFAATLVSPHATATVLTPDHLEIIRTAGMNSTHAPVLKMVTQQRPVQELYADMLSLPVAPADQICPQYIIANYMLTFFVNDTVVQKANALKGECQPVTLGSDDIRTADTNFWRLMNNAFVAGVPISSPVGGSGSSSLKATGA